MEIKYLNCNKVLNDFQTGNTSLVSSPDCHALQAKDGLKQLLQILGPSVKRFCEKDI